MSDKLKILAGLIAFFALATFAFWYPQVAGGGAPPPVLKPAADGSHCIEEAAWMIPNHMGLLNDWRDAVVRGEGQADYYRSFSYEGDAPYEKSLTKTCLKCHTMQSEAGTKRSCSQCHDYANVRPRCMDCHVEPIGD